MFAVLTIAMLAASPTPAPTGSVYKCYTEGGCVPVAPGSAGAQTKDQCEATCGKPTPKPPITPAPPKTPSPKTPAPPVTPAPPATPPPTESKVYACNYTTLSCDEVKPGTPGSASKAICQTQCKATPAPPVTPAPPPTPPPTTPQVYGCDASNNTCVVVAPGTAGAASKEVCNAVCNKNHTGPPGPPSKAKVYKCDDADKTCKIVPAGTAGSGSLQQCTAGGACKVAPSNCSASIDVLFVLDASGSIGDDDWQIDIDATQTVASSFPGFKCNGSSGPQADMGIVQFSDNVNVAQDLTCDEGAFLTTLQGLTKLKSYTYTGDALEAASVEFAAHGRDGVQKVLVLITDGVPCTNQTVTVCNRPQDPVPDPVQSLKAQQQSGKLQSLGVKVASVAVGNFGNNGISFIHSISSQPLDKYVFNPQSWKELPALIDDIVASICPH